MKASDFVSGRQGLDFSSAIENMIKQSCIVDYGIVQEVVADGVVNVSLAVARTEQDMVCMTCVLANIASSNFTLRVVPKVGDRVLVLYPRLFNDTMFNVKGDDSDKEIVVDKTAKGYNLASGIAILLNQYKSNAHENVITFDEGGIFTFANAKVSVSVDEDGAITFTSEKATASIDKDGYVHYANTDSSDNKSKIDFTSSGFLIQDKEGNKIESKKEGGNNYIIINSHLKVKK